MARLGRPTKKAKPGTKASLGLKVTATLKARLEEAAAESGRTQSQEAEYRLERSFDRLNLLREVLELGYGRELAGLVQTIGDTAIRVAWSARGVMFVYDRAKAEKVSIDQCLSDPWIFDEVASAVAILLKHLAPTGDAQPPGALRRIHSDDRKFLKGLGAKWAGDVIEILNDPKTEDRLRWAAENLAHLISKTRTLLISKKDES
jgi:hypothetical protein